ncbi:hypothetical protein WMY93_027128 [Mugilogobius chulae]|uniref:NSFL1 cofactor p47 n=1 Tax=Mugilogobius chulae TaxID=88201 RepID=A0AAW0N2Z2_9GOBI
MRLNNLCPGPTGTDLQQTDLQQTQTDLQQTQTDLQQTDLQQTQTDLQQTDLQQTDQQQTDQQQTDLQQTDWRGTGSSRSEHVNERGARAEPWRSDVFPGRGGHLLQEHTNMSAQEESVREFRAVTDVDEDRARFFLESAGWNLQLALASFFEDGADEDDIVTLPQPEGGSSVSRSTGPSSQSRVTSFRDLMHEAEDDSDEEEGQRFFAGGSERSGQQIVGPPKKKTGPRGVREGSGERGWSGRAQVREGGSGRAQVRGGGSGRAQVREGGSGRAQVRGGGSGRAQAFVGGGYRLGAGPERSHHMWPEKDTPTPAAGRSRGPETVEKWLQFGQRRTEELQRPGNAGFLEAIRRGEIPLELRQRARGGQVNLDMEDHRDEDFVKPKVAFKAFGGEGQKLGSATPDLVSAPPSLQDRTANEAQASASVTLDPAGPVTNIQIRLADGGKLVHKFNHNHRVSDLRDFVVAARPSMAAQEFVLMTTFPNKELSDETQTLQEANLLNAVIVQRLKVTGRPPPPPARSVPPRGQRAGTERRHRAAANVKTTPPPAPPPVCATERATGRSPPATARPVCARCFTERAEKKAQNAVIVQQLK